MHHVDQIEEGRIRGWYSGRSDGCPSLVHLSFLGRDVRLFAVGARPDVFSAGFTLYSGFDLSISASAQNVSCQVYLEETEYTVLPSFKRDTDMVRIDEIGLDFLSGWINLNEDIRTVVFICSAGIRRADIFRRSDVNDHLKTPPGHMHGFRVNGIYLDDLVAVNVNNHSVHWFEPGSLAGRADC